MAEAYKEFFTNARDVIQATIETAAEAASKTVDFLQSDGLQAVLTVMQAIAQEYKELGPYIDEELKKPEYQGKGLVELADAANEGPAERRESTRELFAKALQAAREAKKAADQEKERAAELIKKQAQGREERRQAKEAAEKAGAIMEIKGGILTFFSSEELKDAFAPGRIARMGRQDEEVIDPDTGEVFLYDKEDIIQLNAGEISFAALTLLNTLLASSVENFREYFVKDGSIKFYVQGVINQFKIDPRIKIKGKVSTGRKNANILYLESLFKPLLSFVGLTPDGSRYSVLNYHGYDAKEDTMTVRSPYLFKLWEKIQTDRHERKNIDIKKLPKKEQASKAKEKFKPLEVNMLLRLSNCKEDDTVLEIAFISLILY